VQDVLLVIDDPDCHLGATEIRPEGQPHAGERRKESRRGMRY
jgi:hypothetical protein